MSNVRLIARLDIKAPYLIKGVNLEGVRKVGDPREFAQLYYAEGADEIIYMDAVATLYERNSLADLVSYTAENVFVPITVGGGVRTLDDVATLLRNGADKIAINTAATRRPEFISEVAENFGSQCMVLSIEAKRRRDGGWEAYTDNGREHTHLDAVQWACRGEELGAGEILLTSVDQEGTRKGFDVELCRSVSEAVGIPVIVSGGMGATSHVVEVVQQGKADAVAFADVLHYKRVTLSEIRGAAAAADINVRKFPDSAKNQEAVVN
ncbi:MAG: imidazole glycerol phosphate synthase subunit HisF [Alphaproteobacteria bacterium]|nr:imidazole glycerol phosphate synthase subunit HisF [Alphaproteobacteria bacterium]|tara:strand:+ start:887 stop:1684 length:798 start_codon:yes stop_codon:yes gene_type:complete